MFDASVISRLYANVLNYDIDANRIPASRIKSAIQGMALVYKPDSTSFESRQPLLVDFNDVACRCAYLHKFAPLHTYVVFDVMVEILRQEGLLFRKLVRSERFQFCCLGGGPGSDVIGVLAALHTEFSSFISSATIVDCMQGWESTFRSVIFELIAGDYGRAWNNLAEDFHWKYVGADLLRSLTGEVKTAIATSSLVTMIKFLSAATCKNTDYMVETIFSAMKPGALLLFIDNAGGGFSQLINKTAKKNRFAVLFGPLRHVQYIEGDLKVERFGYSSCYTTTVTIFLLQKPLNSKVSIVDERTPLLHGKKKKRKSLLQRPEGELQIQNPPSVLPPENGYSEHGIVQNIKPKSFQKPLQEIQTVPSELPPSLKKISPRRPFQEKQTVPSELPPSLKEISPRKPFQEIQIVPSELPPSMKEISPRRPFQEKQTIPGELPPSRKEILPRIPFQGIQIDPNHSNSLLSCNSHKRYDSPKPETLQGTNECSFKKDKGYFTNYSPITTQPVSVAGITYRASDTDDCTRSVPVGSVDYPKTSTSSELTALQDKFNAEKSIPNYSSCTPVTNQPVSVAQIHAGVYRSDTKSLQRNIDYLERDTCCPCCFNNDNHDEEICCPF